MRLDKATLVMLMLMLAAAPRLLAAGDTDAPELDEEAIKARLEKLSNEIVQPRYNTVVRSYLLTYTARKRDKAEEILGRRLMYFPLIEEYLEQHNMPKDLRYLPVVESALNPKAVSRAGAVGLWQFMPSTGRYYGLDINDYVDERCDPNRSTVAALRYLRALHDRFGDWELAIAAYNSGGGRVSRAIKRARSKDFWRIRPFLPRETSNYVPAFIAATYLLHHYEDHGLRPRYPELDLQLTSSIRLYERMDFYEIAQITGLPLDIIETLNPSYGKGFIPSAPGEGNHLILPKRVMPAFEDYLNNDRLDAKKKQPLESKPVFVTRPDGRKNAEYTHTIYSVKSNEKLADLARAYNCSPDQIIGWNRLSSDVLREGQRLIIYHPKNIKRYAIRPPVQPLQPLRRTFLPQRISSQASIYIREQKSFITKGGYLYYHLSRPMQVFQIAIRLPDVDAQMLMRLNGYEAPYQRVRADAYVKVRKL